MKRRLERRCAPRRYHLDPRETFEAIAFARSSNLTRVQGMAIAANAQRLNLTVRTAFAAAAGARYYGWSTGHTLLLCSQAQRIDVECAACA